ncbi:hypothetical protein OEA41_005638 [Lepraria neglecta]|uniref:Protein kinase domain-containing protein n=1 Tax=Lepraria neglecta TaxID=209136 RepID=A0AAE0DJG5_9LECA|nr:hypothetical protein OEA41_005638 [Lepraria neglecta]
MNTTLNTLSQHEKGLERSNIYQSRPKDETSGEEASEERESEKEIHHGYYCVTFECRPFTTGFKFVLGRGSGKKFGAMRNVDILLAAPKTKYSVQLKAAHALLGIHPVSGAWMLYTTDDNSSTSSVAPLDDPPGSRGSRGSMDATVRFYDEDLTYNESRPLSRVRTNLEIGRLHYDVLFTITEPEQEALYRETRDKILRATCVEVPRTTISGIPFDIDGSTKTAVFRLGLGSGSFGRVYEGFDRRTGDLRVVKKITLDNKHQRPLVECEIKANNLFNYSEGIVTLYECSNSEGGEGATAQKYPFDVFLVLEKGVSFNKYAWNAEIPVHWELRSILLRQLLQALAVIHRQGCMHRDITPMNILYFEPKRAGFCDFGKICYSRTDTDTALAAWSWLPPEIEANKRNVYDQKIDIWMLGITILHSWYPQVLRGLKYRNQGDYVHICNRLRAEGHSGLDGLLLKMISWDAKGRPSAEQAVSDSCLVNAFHKQPESAKSSDRKRLQA